MDDLWTALAMPFSLWYLRNGHEGSRWQGQGRKLKQDRSRAMTRRIEDVWVFPALPATTPWCHHDLHV